MKSVNFLIVFIVCVAGGCRINDITKVPIGDGWSKTMVNATIFRKNSVVTHNGSQYAAYYDSSATVVLAKRTLGSRKWSIKRTNYTGNVLDAHNVITIMVDGEGYLHMAWDHHNNQLNYCRSVAPESLEMEAPKPMIGTNESSVSYPEFYRLPSGDLIFAYRDGRSGQGNLVMNRYGLKTRTWSRVHENILDGEQKRNAYWQMCVSNDGSIHLSWVWRETYNVETNHDMCYAVSRDEGVTWERSTGEKYELPIRFETAEYAAMIPENSNLINQTSITTDNSGNPFIATYFKDIADSCTQYYVIGKIGGNWKKWRATSRTLDFTLAGMGSRSIPISRPQLVFKDGNDGNALYLIYRDDERTGQIVISRFDFVTESWITYNATQQRLGRWEPSFDTELWKTRKKLHLFVQEVGQESEEKAVEMRATEVCIIEVELR